MVSEHRIIRILFARWINQIRREQKPGWEAAEQTVMDMLHILGVDLDKFEEQIQGDGIIRKKSAWSI